ncbi:type III pantothenate kinase [Luteibaculum oceani]|uniref:Type III pantothenate kinase n=1 Tax=Luteibaculum oceani TaxID=1294296 RepID=A0A5C6USH6_9FLAO|nr:type III pantothenate kinase [Luteibaculum oceani]TXC75620.1 type III pantothenate kinase [Luteibaculum oceani]
MREVGILDIGNTRTKWGIFRSGKLEDYGAFNSTDDREAWIRDFSNPIAVSDVSGNFNFKLSERLHPIDFSAKLPVLINYNNPERLGVDRIANACGLIFDYPGAAMAIDAGSCITYDVVTEKGVFVGGGITPGWSMRLKAMHEFTGKLPLVNREEVAAQFPFNSTYDNLKGSTFVGLCAEITEHIQIFKTQYPTGKVVITGGDAIALQKALKSDIFADPNLTLKGIFNIFKHQYA